MQILDEIWTSIKGNTRTRVKDPVIGTFIVAWCFCNWDKIAVFLWGTDKFENRVTALSTKMSITTNPHLLRTDLDLAVIPIILTLFYLFLLPLISLGVKKLQKSTLLLQHDETIDVEIRRTNLQKELNKAVLRSDPNQEFLAEEIKLDQKREREQIERRNKIKQYIDQKHTAAKADAETKRAQAEKESLELESKKRQSDIEKKRFELQQNITKSDLASTRFPAAYQMMNDLSESLEKDNITISLKGLSSTIASLFGYDNAEEMLYDEKFSNENLRVLDYLYHDPVVLAKKLEQVIKSEVSPDDDLTADLLFDHLLESVISEQPFDLYSDDELAEKILETANTHSLEILDTDEISGAKAETDTAFDELELDIVNYKFDEVFAVKMSGRASGAHRKEFGIIGQDLNIQVTAVCSPTIGKYGLSSYELEDISGSPAYD